MTAYQREKLILKYKNETVIKSLQIIDDWGDDEWQWLDLSNEIKDKIELIW